MPTSQLGQHFIVFNWMLSQPAELYTLTQSELDSILEQEDHGSRFTTDQSADDRHHIEKIGSWEYIYIRPIRRQQTPYWNKWIMRVELDGFLRTMYGTNVSCMKHQFFGHSSTTQSKPDLISKCKFNNVRYKWKQNLGSKTTFEICFKTNK